MTNNLLIKEDLGPGIEDIIFNRKRLKYLLVLLFFNLQRLHVGILATQLLHSTFAGLEPKTPFTSSIFSSFLGL